MYVYVYFILNLHIINHTYIYIYIHGSPKSEWNVVSFPEMSTASWCQVACFGSKRKAFSA